MNTSYYLALHDESNQQYPHMVTSYIGGIPMLPADETIPVCEICGAEETFFFQVAFPPNHVWHGVTLSLFSCTSCADPDYLVPSYYDGSLCGVPVPRWFLERCQRNYRVLTFRTDSGSLCTSYRPRVRFHELSFPSTSGEGFIIGRVGGIPPWSDPEWTAPTCDDGSTLHFLMQLAANVTYPIYPDAPPQEDPYKLFLPSGVDFTNLPSIGTERAYELFLSNQLFLFGSEPERARMIYAMCFR
jgi:hypothetical protein